MKHNLSALLIYLLSLASGFAQTYSVTKASDDGRTDVVNSLSWAIDQANKDRVSSTIKFTVSSLTLTAALPTITQSCTISGASKLCPSSELGGTIIEGKAASGGKFRILAVGQANTTVMLMDLIITKGGDTNSTVLTGAGVYVTDSASIHMERCVVSECRGSKGSGLASYSKGSVTINLCIFKDNGQWSNNVDIRDGTFWIANTTFCNHRGTSLFIGAQARGTLLNSTISGNRASAGTGIVNEGFIEVDHVTIHNNITMLGGAAFISVAGKAFVSNILSSGNFGDAEEFVGRSNIISRGGNIPPYATSLTPSSPRTYSIRFLPLADNGGCVLTHALEASSSGINEGVLTPLSTDQRGMIHVGRPDAGAFETEFVTRPRISGLAISATTACRGQALSVSAVVTNTAFDSFTYTLTNGSDRVSGLSSTSFVSQSLVVSSTGQQTFTLLIEDGYQAVRDTITFTVLACPLVLLPPSYTCQTGAVVFNVSGGNGSPIEFRGEGITDWTHQANNQLDSTGLGAYIRHPASSAEPIILHARQRNADGSYVVVNYTWDDRETCTVAGNPNAALNVMVLDNPTQANTIEVLVESAQGALLQFQILTERGQSISQRTIDNPGALELVRLPLGQSAGVYLLHISTLTAYKTVKVVKL